LQQLGELSLRALTVPSQLDASLTNLADGEDQLSAHSGIAFSSWKNCAKSL
jgi:hypothetical protein